MARTKRAKLQAMAILVCLLSALAVPGAPVMAEPSELFFTEYVEGSSYSKALEIYNGTGVDVDLAAGAYTVEMYFNGSTSAGTTIDLTGTVTDGDVYVVADDGADAAILAVTDQTSTSNFFNGDDAIVLSKGGVVIDVIGQVGFDPGSEWGSGDTSTANNTLRRKDTVQAGDTDGSDAFDPALEWDGFPQDTFDHLGAYGIDYTPIHDIQYTTDASGDSPLDGQDVTTEGVVTALFYNGYFLQDPAGGAWSGIFVYDTNTPILGDRLRLTGTVDEYYNLTQIKDLTAFEVLSSGNALPAAEVLPTGDVSQEQWEGVLVRVEDVTVTDDLGYGEWTVSDGSGDVVIDDKGSYAYAPALGDALAAVIGPLDYAYGAFKIQPRDDGDIVLPGATPIYDIQYTTDPGGDSPLADQEVTTEGVVTGLFYNGYYIQDPAGGPWNGIFVYDSSAPAVGDWVQLTGTVDEYYDLTQIKNLTDYAVLSSGNALPAAEVLPSGSVAQEQWESVLVRVENVTVTDGDLGYGEWSVSDGTGDVVVDDKGSYTYAPASGDALDAVIGPLDYAYGAFKIQPRDDDDIIAPGPGYTPIYDIQYTADASGASPLKGQEVTTEGVVTGRFSYGYYIQDPAGGPWNGVWVYDADNVPAPGDRLRLTGMVDEYFGLTEIKDVTAYTVLSSGDPIPAAALLPSGDVSQEQWESVLVRVENVTVTNDDLGYGEWTVSDGTGDVVIDDKGNYAYVPTSGDVLDAVTGPLDYGFGAFKIQPRDDCDIVFNAAVTPLTIPEVQGAGMGSPYAGQRVRTTGVVVGFFEGNMPSGGQDYDGFYLQDPAGDGDPGTSDGVFVNVGTMSFEVSVGDLVTVIGTVNEFNEYGDPPPETETQIAVGCAASVVVEGAESVPGAISLLPPGDPAAAEAYFESLEGMLVALSGPGAVVGPTNYGTLHVIPGDMGVTRAVRGGAYEGMTFGVRPDEYRGAGADNLIVGSTVEGVDGPLAFTYGDYVVADQDGYLTTYDAPLPDTAPWWPGAAADQLTVASFNTYNFDTTGRERAKVANTIEALGGPLLIGLQEIDVDGVMDALLTDLAGTGYTYNYAYSHPDVGGHGVALLWRTDRVSDVQWSTSYQGCSANGSSSATAYDSYCDGTGLYPLFSRRPVVVSATVSIDGYAAPVIAIGNHFKSKLGGAPSDQRRLEQAQFVAGLVDGFLASDPDANIVVVGDLNDFEDAPPLLALTDSGALSNLWYALGPEARYSYIYEGVSQVLDHILVSQSLLARLVDVDALHANADLPYVPYAYDDETIWRTSDHDPVAATFVFQPPVAAFTPSATNIFEDESVTFANQSTGDALHYSWDFGDETTSDEASPTHSWAAPGLYAVVLTASNDLGSDTASATILVRPRVAPFASFAAHQATVVWSGRGDDGGRVQVDGWLTLPEGYTPADLGHELEITLDAGGATLSAVVPLTENGAVWHLKRGAGGDSAIVKASLIWPKNGKKDAVAFQVIAELADAAVTAGPPQVTVRLALPVLGDQLAERVAGEQTLEMRAHGRSWTYVAP